MSSNHEKKTQVLVFESNMKFLGNNVKDFPQGFFKMRKLKEILADGNPLVKQVPKHLQPPKAPPKEEVEQTSFLYLRENSLNKVKVGRKKFLNFKRRPIAKLNVYRFVFHIIKIYVGYVNDAIEKLLHCQEF